MDRPKPSIAEQIYRAFGTLQDGFIHLADASNQLAEAVIHGLGAVFALDVSRQNAEEAQLNCKSTLLNIEAGEAYDEKTRRLHLQLPYYGRFQLMSSFIGLNYLLFSRKTISVTDQEIMDEPFYLMGFKDFSGTISDFTLTEKMGVYLRVLAAHQDGDVERVRLFVDEQEIPFLAVAVGIYDQLKKTEYKDMGIGRN